ncbi:hypothetical protein M011DRAFT_416567, partial [Sporormia fimetaria CBS 119925]
MASPESALRQAAAEGLFPSDDADAWPKTLQYILDRLDENFHDFPTPPPPADRLTPPSDALSESPHAPDPTKPSASQESHATDKENAPPAPVSAPAPQPAIPIAITTPPSSDSSTPPGVPQEVVAFYTAIRAALQKNFAKEPPHTIQRLAELILEPKKHYKYLPAYLRALDRVVSVTSSSSLFPFPPAVLPSGPSLLNGSTAPSNSLGSDESLGGALLTPIPWLQNRGAQSEMISESTEMVDGPNGAGRIETVSVINGQLTAVPSQPQIASSHPDGATLPATGPVTQGELLRQEQEAGLHLSNPHSINPQRSLLAEMDGDTGIVQTVEAEDEAPHARGPEEIGPEDTGLQTSSRIDIEGAVGRPSLHAERSSKSPTLPLRSVEQTQTAQQGDDKKDGENAEKEKDAEE